MAKRKAVDTGFDIDATQYISTSEAVKTRLRKRRNVTPTCAPLQPKPKLKPKLKPKPKTEATEPILTAVSQPLSLQPLALVHMDELAKIWDADKRTPTVASRRAWALARGVKPDHVHRWWARRKQVAKRKRELGGIPSGTYELPVGSPPIVEVKREATPLELLKVHEDIQVKEEATGVVQLGSDAPSSDRTLVACSPRHIKKHYLRSSSRPSSPLLPPSSPPPLSSVPPSPSPVPSTAVTPVLFLCSPSSTKSRSKEVIKGEVWCTGGHSSLFERPAFTCDLCLCPRDADPDLSLPFQSPVDEPALSAPRDYDHDSMHMELSALLFLLRSPDLAKGQGQVFHGTAPSWWCLDGRSYALDGTFIGACCCHSDLEAGISRRTSATITSWGLDREVSECTF